MCGCCGIINTTTRKGTAMQIILNINILVKDDTLVLAERTGKAITFSKDQTVQKKVSMVALGELCGLSKRQLATGFGFKTRKSYYDSRNAVLHGAPQDLLPKRTGPHTRSKRTKEVEALIIRTRFETDLNRDGIAEALTQRGFKASARLVGQVLADYGLSKKTPDTHAPVSATPCQGRSRNPRRCLQAASTCRHPARHRA